MSAHAHQLDLEVELPTCRSTSPFGGAHSQDANLHKAYFDHIVD